MRKDAIEQENRFKISARGWSELKYRASTNVTGYFLRSLKIRHRRILDVAGMGSSAKNTRTVHGDVLCNDVCQNAEHHAKHRSHHYIL
jgi:hypothetical protein